MALLLTLAMVYLLVTSTLPAIRDRAAIRALRVAEETELATLRAEVASLEQLMQAFERDALVRERFLSAQRLSPDISGPIEVGAPEPDQ